jgi:pimeloyl-ACP methyl ester carboxylesterase
MSVKTRTKVILGSVAAVLLLGPFLVPVSTSGTLTNAEAANELWLERSEFVEVAGHEVHFVSAGDPNSDKLIVLLHGFGASAFSYRDVLEPISTAGFVVAYDRAAFGFTERPTSWDTNPYGIEGQLEVLDEIIDRFGANKEVFVLGHSAGGAIAGKYALENQDRLAGLILYAPAVLTTGGGPSWLNWIYSVPQVDHLGPLLVSSIATNGLDLLYRSYYDPDSVTDQTLAGYTQPLKVIGWERAFWEFNKAPRRTDVGERLEEIRLPTLVITGDTDLVVPTSDSVTVAERIAGSELVVIPKTGHLPNEEAPDEFAKSVVSFIKAN